MTHTQSQQPTPVATKKAFGQRAIAAALAIVLGLAWTSFADEAGSRPEARAMMRIGWATADITPPRAAVLGGMPWARVSTGVLDPLTATALALEAHGTDGPRERIILVSCDLRSVSHALRDGVREALAGTLPDVDSTRIILNATHTHNAPPLGDYGIALKGMSETEYLAFAVPRIADAIGQAWRNRQPGGISFGIAHATVGHNRIMSFKDGHSVMGGKINDRQFSHVEGGEDSAVQLIYTWDPDGKLTGVVINLGVTSQVSQHLAAISADYWHDTREELRRRLGPDLFVLPQCSAAGDQMSAPVIYARAENRMQTLSGLDRRGQIAVRLADAVTSILPVMRKHIEWQPVLRHRTRLLPLPRRLLKVADVEKALAEALPHRQRLEKLTAELDANPDLVKKPDWLKAFTTAYWRARRGSTVENRFKEQQTEPQFPAEVHAIRLGDAVMVFNPFELYLDYGHRIKARSKAVQTFIVQLAGPGSYVPTVRSVAGGAYGAVPASTNIGPEGGQELVDRTVEMIDQCWAP